MPTLLNRHPLPPPLTRHSLSQYDRQKVLKVQEQDRLREILNDTNQGVSRSASRCPAVDEAAQRDSDPRALAVGPHALAAAVSHPGALADIDNQIRKIQAQSTDRLKYDAPRFQPAPQPEPLPVAPHAFAALSPSVGCLASTSLHSCRRSRRSAASFVATSLAPSVRGRAPPPRLDVRAT